MGVWHIYVGKMKYYITVWCYEQVCLAEMFKLPKMLLANLLIARVTCSFCALD